MELEQKSSQSIRKPAVLQSQTLWQKAIEAFRAISKQALYLSFCGMAIPLILFNIYADIKGAKTANEIVSLAQNTAGIQNPDFLDLVKPLTAFTFDYLIVFGLAFFLACASYLGLLQLVSLYYQGKEVPNAGRGFILGLRLAFPRGFIALTFVVFLSVVSQGLSLPALIFAALFLMVPVLIVVERIGIFAAIGRAIAIKYADGPNRSRWTGFFHIMSLGMFLYAAIALTLLAGERLMTLDQLVDIARKPWLISIADQPITIAYVIINALTILINAFFVGFFAVLSTTLYFLSRAICAPLSERTPHGY